MGEGEHDHVLVNDQVGNREWKTSEEEAPHSKILAHSWPERPRGRPLADRIDGTRELVGKVPAQVRTLTLVPVAGRSEVGLGTRVKANPHVLPTTPTACEARPHRLPVLALHGPGADLPGTLLELDDPCGGGVRVGPVFQTEDELVGDAGAFPDRERERGREDGVGGLGRHRVEYSCPCLFAQGPLAG